MVTIQTFSGKKIISDFSALDEVAACLQNAPFFRVNRQYLINRQAILKIAESENRKLNLTLLPEATPKAENQLTVSRYKAKDFMNWFALAPAVVS